MVVSNLRRRAGPVTFAAVLVASAISSLAAGPALASEPEKPAPVVCPAQARGANLVGDDKQTCFSAELAKHTLVNVFTLADPYRVVIELPPMGMQLPQGTGKDGLGLVKAHRSGLFAPGKSRIVLDVTGPVVVDYSVSEAKGAEPALLKLELKPTDRKTFMAGQSRQYMAAANVALPFKLGRQPLPAKDAAKATAIRKRVIVIDPGHGGKDSGAVRNGTVEKEVVLAFGLMLRDKLEASGRYKVLMTRDSDRFIELDERRDFASRHGADLFMAIHADSSPGGAGARGATIYTLRQSVANNLARNFRGSSGSDLLAGVEIEEPRDIPDNNWQNVLGILKDFAAGEEKQLPTKTRTDAFAKRAIGSMGQTTQLMHNPHREAAFRVLVSGQVPSVLIELAYVTNRQDAALLKSDEWRDKVSTSLVAAVNRYFNLARLPM